ncbi:MAG: DUF3179 domain-containing protein [Gemmobacter sp.]
MIDRRRLILTAVVTGASVLTAGARTAASQTLAKQTVPPDWLREWPRTDFARAGVPFAEIVSGGPPKDGIPSIDDPLFRPLDQVRANPPEPVLSVEIDGVARAYPLAVLMWHEIVNDTLGGQPLAVTYCPLCNTGIVFDRVVAGRVTTFGTTGKLRRSDLVMYDRETESWWQQFDGTAIIGTRLGTVLRKVPARMESHGEFAARHPQGQVLVPNAPTLRDYGRNPYVGYDSLRRPFLYDGRYDGPGEPLMRVVHVEGRAEAWSLGLLRARGRITAGDLTLTWSPGQASALDTARIAAGRDVGTVVVTAADGRPVVWTIPFAFAFAAFMPDAPIRHLD